MTNAIVRALHDGPHRGVLHITGGGAGLLSTLLGLPGASATVLDAAVPYSAAALAELLGAAPEQSCSAATARDLAMGAYVRAQALGAGEHGFGFGLTASLATLRRKRGEHRAHFALQTSGATHTWSLTLAKGACERSEEERLVADAALAALGEALLGRSQMPALRPDETISHNVARADADLRALLAGQRDAVGVGQPRAVFPGAFNPLHDGHRQMASLAGIRLNAAVAFEICIRNVDKPPLNFHDMMTRRKQFGREPPWFTNAATFVEKARLFAPVWFVVGADTLSRIADPKYYRTGGLAEAVAELAGLGCRFLVFGRARAGRFVTLEDLALPPALNALCEGVGEADYRCDVSSTALRAGGASLAL